MKYVAILVAVLVASSAALANEARTPINFIAPKDDHSEGTLIPGTPVGGETIGDATVVGSLPFIDTGNTCLYVDDYDEVCPYTGATSPDVVYAFTPTSDMNIKIDLCDSYYDTKLYVYENAVGFLVACNDDFCSGPNYGSPYLSYVELPVYSGQTYYIVVDGYGFSCGNYVIKIDEFVPPPPPPDPEPCDVVCPAGAIMENEPGCGPGYTDHWNGGCNSTPPVFSYLSCDTDPLYFCGESGNWYDPYTGYYTRDTDWWSFTLTEAKTVTLITCANFYVQTLLIIPQPDCSYYTYPYVSLANPFWTAPITAALGPGEYWYWVGPQSFYADTPCGSQYVSSIEGWCTPDATENKSWGAVKEMFR
ncbi:MAG: hypothetical protein ABIK65_00595 [Candidatus Eisenbacteria bacterium]